GAGHQANAAGESGAAREGGARAAGADVESGVGAVTAGIAVRSLLATEDETVRLLVRDEIAFQSRPQKAGQLQCLGSSGHRLRADVHPQRLGPLSVLEDAVLESPGRGRRASVADDPRRRNSDPVHVLAVDIERGL